MFFSTAWKTALQHKNTIFQLCGSNGKNTLLVKIYIGANYTSQTATDFAWYNPHLSQSTTENIKLHLITVFKASEVFPCAVDEIYSPTIEEKTI